MCTLNLPEDWEMLSFESCLKKVKSKKVSSILQKNYQKSGAFPVIDQGEKFISGWTDSVESVVFDNLPVVVFGVAPQLSVVGIKCLKLWAKSEAHLKMSYIGNTPRNPVFIEDFSDECLVAV